MSSDAASQGVSYCCVFKSRLEEYAQKVGLSKPVYETIKVGRSHEPTFRSTVIVNDIRYDSLPGFFNRKAAEQSAAEVALTKMAQSGEMNECVPQPLHETGWCKNLVQEYAQKMSYGIPLYECRQVETTGREILFSCEIEIGGIRYMGAYARTKKEAEINAARIALLTIKSSASEVTQNTESTKKRPTIRGMSTPEPPAAAALKPKKRRLKKKKKSLKQKCEANGASCVNAKLGGRVE